MARFAAVCGLSDIAVAVAAHTHRDSYFPGPMRASV